MRRIYISIFTLLAFTSFVHAFDFAMLSNQQIALVPLRTYCTFTGTAFTKTGSNYLLRNAEHTLAFHLYERTIIADGKDVTVPTPPILMEGITLMPLRICAATFGDTVVYLPNPNYDRETRDEQDTPYNPEADPVPASKYLVFIHHAGKTLSLFVHGTVQYLDTSGIAPDSCAFSVYATCSDIMLEWEKNQPANSPYAIADDQLFPLAKDMFIAQAGKLIWSSNGQSVNGDLVTPPKILSLRNSVKLITFASLQGASVGGIDFYALHIVGNRVVGGFSRRKDRINLDVAPGVGDAGAFHSNLSVPTQLITFEIVQGKTPDIIRYHFTWYQWQHGTFQRIRQQNSYRMHYVHMGHKERLHTIINVQQQHVFRRYHIAGDDILDIRSAMKELPPE